MPSASKKLIDAIKKKKKPSRKMLTPERRKELEKIHKEAIKKGKKPKSNMPMLKRGGKVKKK
jgi:hypothetical protein